jgi:predicted GNAT family N-acyltransferase
MNNKISIKQVKWQEAESDLRQLREAVFIREQHVPEELEWDGVDAECTHLLAYDAQGTPIATARMQLDGKIGRMAVLPAWRRQGVGSALLQSLLDIARRQGLEAVTLDAQLQAMGFYKRLGFEAEGATFMDANIPHRHMRLALDADTADDSPAGMDFSSYVLGQESGPVHFNTRADNRAAALGLVTQGERSLHLMTRNLDPVLYNTEPFIDAVRRLAIASPRSKVYILLQDPSDVVARGHRIVELARRISSHIFINRACEDDQERTDSFLIVDQVGLMYRPHANRFEGTVDFHAPGQARQLLKVFEEAWERSQPEPELRRLHI